MKNFNEKQFEDILVTHPELIEEGLTLKARQPVCYGRRMDLLFQDRFGQQLIVELKVGPIKDQHMGQILSYEGMILSADDPTVRVMLIGNRVPPNLQKALDHHGIAWKEITFDNIKNYLPPQSQELYVKLAEPSTPVKTGTDKMTLIADTRRRPHGAHRNIFKSEFDQSSLEDLWDEFKPGADAIRYLKKDAQKAVFCKDLISGTLDLAPEISARLNDSHGVKIYDNLGRFFFCVFPMGTRVTVAPLLLTPEDVRRMNCSFRDITDKKYAMGGLVRVDFRDYGEKNLKLGLELARRSFHSKNKIDTWRIIK